MFSAYKLKRILLLVMAGLAILAGHVTCSLACPLCGPPSLTLSEQIADVDVVALGRWKSATQPTDMPTDIQSAATIFTLLRVANNANQKRQIKQIVTVAQYLPGNPGDLYLLTANTSPKTDDLEWSAPLEMSEAAYEYIVKAPNPDIARNKRLLYFMKFLEYPDHVIANDAYSEFANAPYEDIASLTKILPHEKIRKWVSSEETSPVRLGLYGLMLGLCGNESDAKVMQAMIAKETEDFRLGIQGVIAGYLMIKGEDGLAWLEEHKLKPAVNPAKQDKIPFSETFACMEALRFLWTYDPGRISKKRLKQAMRILLDNPELCEIVIRDLSRWKDWSIQDRLMRLYNREGFNTKPIKKSIVKYLLSCSEDVPEGVAEIPAHAARARKRLDELRESDPKIVDRAERSFR